MKEETKIGKESFSSRDSKKDGMLSNMIHERKMTGGKVHRATLGNEQSRKLGDSPIQLRTL